MENPFARAQRTLSGSCGLLLVLTTVTVGQQVADPNAFGSHFIRAFCKGIVR
jgi:hypothetical protein